MAKFVPEDVVERILIESDVKDLIRCKSVCKSWHSLISSSRFINHHLKHNYNKDRCNVQIGHRRIILGFKVPCVHHLVGSSNGLVCIIYGFDPNVVVRKSEVLIGNPLTREVRQLELPRAWKSFSKHCGFGYDSSVDDYKVVVGLLKARNQACFYVLSLKSNVWKFIGEVKYRFISKVGILCNGALHWIVKDQNNKKLIICYDLSKEEFKEIPQPEGYKITFSSCLGIMKESLCIFNRHGSSIYNVWLMKNYNIKESWENIKESWEKLPLSSIKSDIIVHSLKSSIDNVAPSWVLNTFGPHYRKMKHIDAPIFVRSLVSPHVNGKPSEQDQ